MRTIRCLFTYLKTWFEYKKLQYENKRKLKKLLKEARPISYRKYEKMMGLPRGYIKKSLKNKKQRGEVDAGT